jgi:hypothetical protein
MDASGMNVKKNWERSYKMVDKLQMKFVPFGISIYGRIHTAQIYFLSSLCFVSNIVYPPPDLIRKAYQSIDRFLLYPTKVNAVPRAIVMMPSDIGGLGYPDLDIRIKVNRIVTYVKRLTHKEALSWQKSFDHFFGKIRNVGRNGVQRANVPWFYKNLKMAIFQTDFRQDGNFISFFGEKIAMKSVTPKGLYRRWVVHKYKNLVIARMIGWETTLNTQGNFLINALSWTKAKYVDGCARDIHYKLVMKSLYTRDKISKFSATPDFCKLCFIKGIVIKEDITHVFFYCSRAYETYAKITPFLENISGCHQTDMIDLIFGKKMDKTNCIYNYMIQMAQHAIWSARNNLELDRLEIHAFDILKKLVFRNLCRQKVFLGNEKFFQIFYPIVDRANSPIGFRSKLL